MSTADLPIQTVLPELLTTIEQHNEVVLEAPPGAGKTTQVPLTLLEASSLAGQTILLVEPRRLAAKAAATRLAQQLNEPVGETVGYRVRLEQEIGPHTRLEVITEGILTRRLQSDPELEGVGLVIFDEFHERNLEADLALALILEGREILRDEIPLKLLVMSATLDGEAIAKLLGDAPRVRSEGRSYPIELFYRPQPPRVRITEAVAAAIELALTQHDGSLLVFLPGQREIREVTRLLASHLESNVLVAPLYGDLSLADQQRAIDPPPAGRRKVVLATSIAETSLTIEGIQVVVDSGLARSACFDPNLGITRLQTKRVSKAAAKQRAGRAGRLGPGICYRLWSETEQAGLAPFATAEILQADLAPLALQLLSWGIDDPTTLAWLNPPPAAAYQQALDLLGQLNAINQTQNGPLQLTDHGKRLATLPMHPRLAHLMICGAELGHSQLAAELSALLSDRDPLAGDNASADIEIRLELLHEPLKQLTGSLRGRISRTLQLTQRFKAEIERMVVKHQQKITLSRSDACAALLALAYPERIAGRRNEKSADFRLANGRGATVDTTDPLRNHNWLACAQLSSVQNSRQDRIHLAAALPSTLIDSVLQPLVRTGQIAEWDTRQQRLFAENQRRIGSLIIESRPAQIDNERRVEAICHQVRKQGIDWLQFDSQTEQLRQRVNFVHSHDQSWPDFSDSGLRDTLEQWLGPYLNQVTTLNQLRQLDFHNILKSCLPWPKPQELDKLAPERFQVPSGSRFRIDYSQTPPVLAVRLQQMFGVTKTPTIGFGVALLIHLLSPANRPLQVTQDLAGFWSNGYAEVKKEMKGRYPKHNWDLPE